MSEKQLLSTESGVSQVDQQGSYKCLQSVASNNNKPELTAEAK